MTLETLNAFALIISILGLIIAILRAFKK